MFLFHSSTNILIGLIYINDIGAKALQRPSDYCDSETADEGNSLVKLLLHEFLGAESQKQSTSEFCFKLI